MMGTVRKPLRQEGALNNVRSAPSQTPSRCNSRAFRLCDPPHVLAAQLGTRRDASHVCALHAPNCGLPRTHMPNCLLRVTPQRTYNNTRKRSAHEYICVSLASKREKEDTHRREVGTCVPTVAKRRCKPECRLDARRSPHGPSDSSADRPPHRPTVRPPGRPTVCPPDRRPGRPPDRRGHAPRRLPKPV